ncbi:MAG: sigma-70 family RNA polymerase sigma factor [Ginsengibacter sp.]
MRSQIDNDITDAELLQNFYNDHDNKWLGILLPRYTLLLLGVCMKHLKNEEDARDCVQHIFLKVINELHKYHVEYFKSWIYMIAKNHCLMKLRGNKKVEVELNEHLIAAENTISDRNELIAKDKLFHLMEVAMQQLNKEQQICLKLFYLEKKSYAEVAEISGFSVLQVKSYLQNGKRNLKLIMEKLKNESIYFQNK